MKKRYVKRNAIISIDDEGFLSIEQGFLSDGGWTIKEKSGEFFVYETPEFGGTEFFYKKADTLKEAYNLAINLT